MTSIDEIVRELSGLMEKAKRQWPERWELVRDGAYADIRRVGTPYNITTDMPRHQAALAVAVENHLPALLSALSRSRRMEEVLRNGLQLKGGWREAIVELEDHCSEPVRLKNMVAAADQLDEWATQARAAIEESK